MKRFLIMIMIILIFVPVYAGENPYIISQSYFIKMMPVYQQWSGSNNSSISEFSIPLFVYLPVGRQLGITFRGNQANISGDVPTLNGLTDTQLAVSYHLESMNLVFNTGLNLPSGKKELTVNEFQTSALLSLNHFNFAVPNFGQGLNVSSGLSWALPLRDNFVVGLGASYQYKGQFKPIAGMVDPYSPGDELLLTGGFDFRLGPASSLSADVIFTSYGADKIAGSPVFESGNRIVINTQFRRYFGHNRLWLLARYRSKSKNNYAVAGAMLEETERTAPNQLEFIGQFNLQMSSKLSLGLLAEIRYFEKTPIFPGINIFGFGIEPRLSISQSITIPVQVKYSYGKYKTGEEITGLEAGIGLEIKL